MELEGRKELVDTGKSSRTWSVPTVSLRFDVLNVFQGFFGPKMAVFGPKLQFLKRRSATCESRSGPPPLSFSLKLCVIVLHTHRYHPPKFHLNPKHHDGVLIFPFRACCLLAACLLAAKPGRSTLDTKKGYKTKTGSTSSVTLTLLNTLQKQHAISDIRHQTLYTILLLSAHPPRGLPVCRHDSEAGVCSTHCAAPLDEGDESAFLVARSLGNLLHCATLQFVHS